MAVKFSGALIVISVICSLFNGRTEILTSAAITGAGKAVTTAFSLMALMCLWSGIMRVAESTGVLDRFSKLIRPIMRLVFPEAMRSGKGIKESTAAISANILGIGNAATPLAINAMKTLPKGKNKELSQDMITFTLIGCAPPCLFPTTVVTLRSAMGSRSPASIVPLVWICSFSLCLISIILSRISLVKNK